MKFVDKTLRDELGKAKAVVLHVDELILVGLALVKLFCLWSDFGIATSVRKSALDFITEVDIIIPKSDHVMVIKRECMWVGTS